jgi:hypothetical protein
MRLGLATRLVTACGLARRALTFVVIVPVVAASFGIGNGGGIFGFGLGAAAAATDRVSEPQVKTDDGLPKLVRERAGLIGKDTARTALEALAAVLGESCFRPRGEKPGVAVLGFPNLSTVGLPPPEATALRDEVKDAVSRMADLIALVPIDDIAATHDVLETIRLSGSAEVQALARRALDERLQSSVDVVIHFSQVVASVDGATFQVNVVTRDGQCAQSRTVPLAPDRLVSGDLRVIVDQAARAAREAALIGAMGSGDALVVIAPMVEGRLQSSLWADAFADALAQKLRIDIVRLNRHARRDLIGAYGTLPHAEASRYLWLQPSFTRDQDAIRFRLDLFPTEGDRLELLKLTVAEAVVPEGAWQTRPTLELAPAKQPFIREREEVDYRVTSRSRLSMFCHFLGSNGFSSLITPSARTPDLHFSTGALLPADPLDQASLYDLSDRRFPRRRITAHVEMVECVGVPVLPPEARSALAKATQDWLRLSRVGGGIHPTSDVRALFTGLPLFHRDWVARALGHIVDTTNVPDRDRADAVSPALRP